MSEISSNTNRIRLAATANPFGARGNKKEKERKLIWLNGHWPPSSSIYWRTSRREQTYVYSGPNLNSPMKIKFFLSCNCWNKIEFWKFSISKFLDAGIQDGSTSISIIHDLKEK